MSKILQKPLQTLGYQFVPQLHTQSQANIFKDEYYYRNKNNTREYRALTEAEIEQLIQNGNSSDNWTAVLVSDLFDPRLIRNCEFFGLVRIGRLKPLVLSHKSLNLPIGLYNSTIISCDIGDLVCIKNVHYLSYFSIGDSVILFNIDEIVTTSTAKFGNGVVKFGEKESQRIAIELCNEKGGRAVIPFENMLPGDAYLWSRFRADQHLQSALFAMTEREFDELPGHYGEIGAQTVIKNCKMIKDVRIGSFAYIKGANKLKNLTIKSNELAPSQIGEGCELVNGIIHEGCRIFYGVKAVRFILASNSQLKYGARLINSYLGNNSTVSCCEVLNSLIFPGHEQHHNNSFLCASLVMGQSNMAAGATIGSNHNSRGADGELIAGRGFWPGLCVSLKHNSRFASFVLITKGNYPFELDIHLPFSLVANDESKNQLMVMPAYWFIHNFYALARNCYKIKQRDQRLVHSQILTFDFLAPDTIYELIHAIEQLEHWAGTIYCDASKTQSEQKSEGRVILNKKPEMVEEITLLHSSLENSKRPVLLRKVGEAYQIYKNLIKWNLAQCIIERSVRKNLKEIAKEIAEISIDRQLSPWWNVGGQLISEESMELLKLKIKNGQYKYWKDVHDFYLNEQLTYQEAKWKQAVSAYARVFCKNGKDFISELSSILEESKKIHLWMVNEVKYSRVKDYQNAFKSMVYNSIEEMEEVIGSMDDDPFLTYCEEQYRAYAYKVDSVLKKNSVLISS